MPSAPTRLRAAVALACLMVPVAAGASSAQATDRPGYRVIRLDGGDLSDLEFLRQRLRGVRIVQLGESGHGMAEASRIKTRLIRFLHEEMGFGVLAFESSLYQCHDADVRAADASARVTLLRCVFGVWHTEEVLPLFEHIRSSRRAGRPLRLAGIDIQPIGPNKEHRPAFLARVAAALDSSSGTRIAVLDSTFLAAYALGGSERRARLREFEDELVGGYAAFADALEPDLERVAAEVGRADALVAVQTARSMAAYVRQQTSPDMRTWAETRDRGMAENVEFLAERLFPGEKVIVWAANYHVRHANEAIPPTQEIFPGLPARAMGGWLRERYGGELFTVGVYAYRGEAVDNSRDSYEIPPPTEGALETLALPSDPVDGAVWISLRRDAGAPAWTVRPLIARYNGRHPQRLVPADQYDALVLLPLVTRPAFLY